MEDNLQNTFLPDLFQGGMSQIPRRAITGLPFKKSGVALPDPTHTTGENWMASCIITGHLAAELHKTDEFRSGDHALLLGNVGRRSDGSKRGKKR